MNLRRFGPDSLFVRLFVAILLTLGGALAVIVVLLLTERQQMRVVWNNAAWSAPLFGAQDPPVTATVVGGGRAGSFQKTLFLPYPALPDGERVLFPAPPPPP